MIIIATKKICVCHVRSKGKIQTATLESKIINNKIIIIFGGLGKGVTWVKTR